MSYLSFLDGYCSTAQGLLDWLEVDLGFNELLFIQIDLCVMCVMCVISPIFIRKPYLSNLYTARKASWNIEGVEPGNQQGPG